MEGSEFPFRPARQRIFLPVIMSRIEAFRILDELKNFLWREKRTLKPDLVMARDNRLEAVSIQGSLAEELGRLRICRSSFNGLGHSPALQPPGGLLLYCSDVLVLFCLCFWGTLSHSRILIGQHQFVLLYLMSTRSCEAKTSGARVDD